MFNMLHWYNLPIGNRYNNNIQSMVPKYIFLAINWYVNLEAIGLPFRQTSKSVHSQIISRIHVVIIFMLQAPASLLLSWHSTVLPPIRSRPVMPLWSVWHGRCLSASQRWAGWSTGVRSPKGLGPAPQFSTPTRLSNSAAICPFQGVTARTGATHVKWPWVQAPLRKRWGCLNVGTL